MAKRTCSIEGCGNPHLARGWCQKHYKRWQKHGDPTIVLPPRPRVGRDLGERFWSKVTKTETCWLWTGTIYPNGYGYLVSKGRTFYAHRLAYQLMVGPIPEGLTIDHVKVNGCTSRACVKAIVDEFGPAHLEPVTIHTNLMRGDGPAALNARKTHCVRGHPFDEANTRHNKKTGTRTCRACDRQKHAEKRLKGGAR